MKNAHLQLVFVVENVENLIFAIDVAIYFTIKILQGMKIFVLIVQDYRKKMLNSKNEVKKLIVGLHDSDYTGFPNYALMKISQYHKNKGDIVEWWSPLFKSDIVYSSKIFSYTPKNPYLPEEAILGGTGYNIKSKLSYEIENELPDYSIYNNLNYCIGFLTRGCPNTCPWCLVPQKEGKIYPYRDIEEISINKNVVLMDNNVLASEYGIKQIEKISKMNIKVDFNQGLDATRIDNIIAKLLAKCSWFKPIRLACDHQAQKKHILKAITLLRKYNAKPKKYFCYVLIRENEIEDALDRVLFLKNLGVDPFVQPFRNFNTKSEPSERQKKFARWVNHKAIFKTVKWEQYNVKS